MSRKPHWTTRIVQATACSMSKQPSPFVAWFWWQVNSVFIEDFGMQVVQPLLARHASSRLTARFAASLNMQTWDVWQRDLACSLLLNPHTTAEVRRDVWERSVRNLEGYRPQDVPVIRRRVGRFSGGYSAQLEEDLSKAWTRLAEALIASCEAFPSEFSEQDDRKAQSILFLYRLSA